MPIAISRAAVSAATELSRQIDMDVINTYYKTLKEANTDILKLSNEEYTQEVLGHFNKE